MLHPFKNAILAREFGLVVEVRVRSLPGTIVAMHLVQIGGIHSKSTVRVNFDAEKKERENCLQYRYEPTTFSSFHIQTVEGSTKLARYLKE